MQPNQKAKFSLRSRRDANAESEDPDANVARLQRITLEERLDTESLHADAVYQSCLHRLRLIVPDVVVRDGRDPANW